MKANKRITKTILTIITITLLGTTVFAEETTESPATTEEPKTSTSTETPTTTEPKETTPTETETKTETKVEESESKKETETPAQTPSTTETKTQPQTQTQTQTQTKSQTQTVTKTQNKTVNQTTTSTPATKSNNANLSNLGITPHDFSGFRENKTDYSVTVPNNITEIEVYATTKDSKASIEGTGKVKLQEGENTAKVVVTAEDGTTKTYIINIKRLKSGEKETVTQSSSGTGLSKLEIKGIKIEPSFNEEVYQYKANFEGDERSLDILAEASKAGASVKIIGNENLMNGQNIITILVTDSKESSVTTYQIYANKNMMEQEELDKEFEEAQKQYEIKQWIIRILVTVIVVCIIILLILIYKKTNDEEYQHQKSKRKSEKGNSKEYNQNGNSGRHSK